MPVTSLLDDASPPEATSPYLRLREEIVSGVVPRGKPVVESIISERFGVSRTPIREALQRLETDGLVIRSGRSYRVREATPAEILDIYEVRIALEATAARSAAQRRDEIDLTRLFDAVQPPSSGEQDDAAKNFAANDAFHGLVRAAAHNASLDTLLSGLLLQIRLLDNIPVARREVISQTYDEHAKIVEAIAAHDADAAGTLMTAHLGRTRDLRLRAIAESGAYGLQ